MYFQVQSTKRALSRGTGYASGVTSCVGSNSSSSRNYAVTSSRVMFQRWLDESPDEGPYIALGTMDSVEFWQSNHVEEEAEISDLDLER